MAILRWVAKSGPATTCLGSKGRYLVVLFGQEELSTGCARTKRRGVSQWPQRSYRAVARKSRVRPDRGDRLPAPEGFLQRNAITLQSRLDHRLKLVWRDPHPTAALFEFAVKLIKLVLQSGKPAFLLVGHLVPR